MLVKLKDVAYTWLSSFGAAPTKLSLIKVLAYVPVWVVHALHYPFLIFHFTTF